MQDTFDRLPGSLTIRRATWLDAAGACRLVRAALGPWESTVDPAGAGPDHGLVHPTPVSLATCLQEPDVRAWVATCDGMRVGFAMVRGDRLELLCVSPDCQRRGVGRRLLAQLMAELRSAGLTCLLLNGVPATAALFLKLGFRLMGSTSAADGVVNQRLVKVLRSPSPVGPAIAVKSRGHEHKVHAGFTLKVNRRQPGQLSSVARSG